MTDKKLTSSIDLSTLPEYESKLLLALAFFLGRDVTPQARACLSMYLRQSEPRIMAQVEYYAHQASKAAGAHIDKYEFLDLIFESPDRASTLTQTQPVHLDDEADIFEDSL